MTERTPGNKASTELLTLKEVSRHTNISYPTLIRIVEEHGGEIPSEIRDGERLYPSEAIAVFKNLHSG